MAKEIKLTLTGYRTDEVSPDKSGNYICRKEYPSGDGEIITLPYSAKHRAWNARDNQSEEFVELHKIDGITHWFRIPEAPEVKQTDIGTEV